jgi:hypothetical protein
MFAEPEICLKFETYLDFSRPLFSEIKMQIKRLNLKVKNASSESSRTHCKLDQYPGFWRERSWKLELVISENARSKIYTLGQ